MVTVTWKNLLVRHGLALCGQMVRGSFKARLSPTATLHLIPCHHWALGGQTVNHAVCGLRIPLSDAELIAPLTCHPWFPAGGALSPPPPLGSFLSLLFWSRSETLKAWGKQHRLQCRMGQTGGSASTFQPLYDLLPTSPAFNWQLQTDGKRTGHPPYSDCRADCWAEPKSRTLFHLWGNRPFFPVCAVLSTHRNHTVSRVKPNRNPQSCNKKTTVGGVQWLYCKVLPVSWGLSFAPVISTGLGPRAMANFWASPHGLSQIRPKSPYPASSNLFLPQSVHPIKIKDTCGRLWDF